LLALEDGAAAFDGAFRAVELVGNVSVGSSADKFILGWRPLSKLKCRLVDAQHAALLPDRAKGAAGELSDLGIGKLAQQSEFLFCPWLAHHSLRLPFLGHLPAVPWVPRL